MNEVSLMDFLSTAFQETRRELVFEGGADLADQLVRVVIPVQAIAGNADSFSFMAFPLPRLSLEERNDAHLRDEVKYRLRLNGIEIGVDIDQFGQIAWFHVDGAPDLYEKLKGLLIEASKRGDTKPFWKY